MEISKIRCEITSSIVASIGILYVAYKLKGFVCATIENRKIREKRKTRLVVITGCDTGLGLTMSKWALDAGYNVLAGCLNVSGEGPQLLVSSNNNDGTGNGGNPFVQQLDVTQRASIEAFARRCQDILNEHSLELYALIANAAVAIPAEFFWITEDQGRHQMNVNFWGVATVADIFQRQLLENKSRLIVISSDCADFPFPGLAVYAATKGALENWAIALRLEVAKFGMTVVNFQPGSFALQSRMMSCQERNTAIIKDKIKENNMEDFHGRNSDAFFRHWKIFDSNPAAGTLVVDKGIYKAFFTVLEKDMSKTLVFKYESWSHSIFHNVLRLLPRSMADAMILKVLNSPSFPRETQVTPLNE